jgi:hypothetical protein
MKFVPDQSLNQKAVPYFEDATKKDGYGGYTVTRENRSLKSDVTQAISRLGGTVTGFVSGKFVDETDAKRTRPGFSITYTQSGPSGVQIPGRIDFAGLPCRNINNIQKSEKMALWMVAKALEAMFYFEQMAPGYSTLMPFMLADKKGQTLFEVWGNQLLALPEPSRLQNTDEIVEGEIV